MRRDNCFADRRREYPQKCCCKQLVVAPEVVPRLFFAEELQYAAAVLAVPSVGINLSEFYEIDDLLMSTRPFYLFLLIEDRYRTKGLRRSFLEDIV